MRIFRYPNVPRPRFRGPFIGRYQGRLQRSGIAPPARSRVCRSDLHIIKRSLDKLNLYYTARIGPRCLGSDHHCSHAAGASPLPTERQPHAEQVVHLAALWKRLRHLDVRLIVNNDDLRGTRRVCAPKCTQSVTNQSKSVENRTTEDVQVRVSRRLSAVPTKVPGRPARANRLIVVGADVNRMPERPLLPCHHIAFVRPPHLESQAICQERTSSMNHTQL